MKKTNQDILKRMQAGESIPFDDPQYSKISDVVSRTIKLTIELNNSTDTNQSRDRMSEIIG